MTPSSAIETAAWRRGWAVMLVGSALLLGALTVLNFFAMDRYLPAGPAVEMLPRGGVWLENTDPDGVERLDLAVPLPAKTPFVQIAAKVDSWRIAPGPRPWNRGRIVFVKRNADGRGRWDLPHVVALMKGESGRRSETAVFAASPDAASLDLRIELLKATGRLAVRSVTATPMKEAPGFRPAADFLIACWIALAAAISFWAFLRLSHRRWLVGLCWAVATTALVLSILPAETTAPARTISAEAIDLVARHDATPKERKAALSENMFSIAKTGHVLMFLGVGLAFALARGGSPALRIWLLALLFASTCEMLQLFSPNRSPAFFDLMLNTVSATAGYWLGWSALSVLRRTSL